MAFGAEILAQGATGPAVETAVAMTHAVVTRADAAVLLRRSPSTSSAARRGVIRLPESGAPRLVSGDALARMAGLAIPRTPGIVFSLSYSVPRHVGTCVAARSAIAAGSALHTGQLEPAPCDGAASGALRYDRATARTLAARSIPAGARLGRLAPSVLHSVSAGEAVTVRSSVGPVSVDRQATALQSGDPGGSVFVRTGAGAAFAVPLARGTGE